MASDIIAQHSGQGPKPRMPEPLDLGSTEISYDSDLDSLGLMFGAARAGSTVVNPDGVWWRIDSETGEIYGIEIQAFERYFLQTFPDDAQMRKRMQDHWDTLKSNSLQGGEARAHFAGHILRLVGLIDGHAALATSLPLL